MLALSAIVKVLTIFTLTLTKIGGQRAFEVKTNPARCTGHMMEQRGSNFPSEPLTLLKNTKLEGDVSDLGLNILECV